MRLMTNTWVVVYANCLVSWKRAWNVDSDDLNLSPCFSSLCLCVWVTWGSHFFSPFVQWDPGSHSSQGWWNNVNHDWRARALPCLQTFPKPSPLPTHHILHGEASSSVAQGETEALFISLEHRWAVPAGTLHILSIKCYSLLSSLILLTWSHARFGGMAGPCTENLSLLFISH